ncbi:MAG: L,D-transpeptidase family protein [Alphaproteobacteria bacterium]
MFLVFILFALLSLSGAAQAETGVYTQPSAADMADITPEKAAELNRFYDLRDYRVAWNLSDDAAMKKTLAFIDSMQALIDYHGLDINAYPFDIMRQLTTSKSDADKQKLEWMITESLLHLAHDLHGDSTDLEKLYPGWTLHRHSADIPDLLNTAITDGTLETFFAQIAPQNPSYSALTKALQTYRAVAAQGHWPTVPLGPPLHPQDSDPRVARLRARLAAEGYVTTSPDGRDDFFDDELNKALIAYQTRNGLQPDGHVGPKTLDALNTSVAARIDQIRANMERWRHMPEDFPPDRYTLVNIPAFTVTIVEDGKEVYQGDVVDGREDRRTPFVASRIVNMVVNPSWHVPVSIARKDILPKLQKDPHYLETLGIVITGRDEDPSGTTIDWKNTRPDQFNYQLRQVPGDLNSLGQLKFNFTNPFDVYMHGTPHQELFAKPERSFSSGCVRLKDPVRVGEILLKYNKEGDGWPQQRIEDEIAAEKTHFVTLTKTMPLYFLYWSVFPDADGQVNFRRDLYGYDSLLIEDMNDRDDQPSDNQ